MWSGNTTGIENSFELMIWEDKNKNKSKSNQTLFESSFDYGHNFSGMLECT